MQTSYNSQANYSLACVSSETHIVQRVFHPGGGGLLPYIGYIGMCGAKGYVFVAVGLKEGINFDHCGLK